SASAPSCCSPGISISWSGQRTRPSRLIPWETGHAPTPDGVAMAFRVLVPLESFDYVVGLRVAGADGCFGSQMRARSAAADEHHQGFPVNLRLELRQERLVRMATGIRLPFDLDAARNAAHIIELR